MNWLQLKYKLGLTKQTIIKYSELQSIDGIVVSKIRNFEEALIKEGICITYPSSLIIKTDLFTQIVSDFFLGGFLEKGDKITIKYRLRTRESLDYLNLNFDKRRKVVGFTQDYVINSIDYKRINNIAGEY